MNQTLIRLQACVFASLFIIGGISSIAHAQTPPAKLSVQDQEIFPNEVREERGWKGLARILDSIGPSADTSRPLTANEITQRIQRMLDAGQAAEALDSIEKRLAQREARHEIGSDVQLLFLQGRALSALNRHDDAIAIYQQLTIDAPELPEPWNNLAAEYMRQGKLLMAKEALEMALTADPNYRVAHANLGEVQLLLANEAFKASGQLGQARTQQTQQILQQ